MNELNHLEYSVLGQKVRFRSSDDEVIAPIEIVELVQKEAEDIRNKHSIKDPKYLAILTALKLAQDKLHLEGDYKQSISDLQLVAEDALKIMEEVVPIQ
jgi:cell division protein ZapA (FtsZ GTPase activity inhibitor)